MMIEVNLLPAELRRVEHTPLPRFLVVIIGTAAIMAMAAFGVVVNWRSIPDLKARETDLSGQVARNATLAGAYDRLLEDIAETQDRKQAIAEVWRTRIMWSPKLAQLAEITPAFIGLKDARLAEARTATLKEESGGEFTVDCLSAGADHARVAYYRRLVQGQVPVKDGSDPWVGRQFFASFLDILPTSTEKIEVRDYEEKEALKFLLKMPVKPPSSRLSEAVQAVQDETNRKRAEEKAHTVSSAGKTTPKGTVGAASETPVQVEASPAAPERPSSPEAPVTDHKENEAVKTVPSEQETPSPADEKPQADAGDTRGEIETSAEKPSAEEAPATGDKSKPVDEKSVPQPTTSRKTGVVEPRDEEK